MIPPQNSQAIPANKSCCVGDLFGLEIPADSAALVADGAGFLTRAFHAAGVLTADNRVSRIVQAEEFFGGGSGKKLRVTVAYQFPDANLPEQLFIKFSRNFENELWDRARFSTIAEVHLALLSRAPDFPVAVPLCLFADIELESATGLIISDCISYGRNGVEPLHPKCMDYALPAPLEYYKTIMKGLARLSGAHRGGRLRPDFDEKFPFDPERFAAAVTIDIPTEKLLQRAKRMFDFIDRYPPLFPESVRTLEFREQFMRDIPDVVAAGDRIGEVLRGNPDFFAFAHWNANVDNCWFWRDAAGALQCGFIDWANAGKISVAQSIHGAISGASADLWDNHLDELLTIYIAEYVAQGGPPLNLAELRLHVLLIVAVGGMTFSMGAPVAMEREIADIGALENNRDSRLADHDNARIQLHMTTRMLSLWQTQKLGDMVRAL